MSGFGMNTRLLVIDDEESVRDSFQTILAPPQRVQSATSSAAAALFGEPEPAKSRNEVMSFELDTAATGKEGLALVEAALEAERPYAVIFCDMRMPGWDGVQTIEAIRALDARAEVVFVTAFSDHSVETIRERAGANVGYFVKPFMTDEVHQLATKLVLDWNKARELEQLIQTLTSIRGSTEGIDVILTHLLSQIATWLDTESAALYRQIDDRAVFHTGIGALADPDQAEAQLEAARSGTFKGKLLPIEGFGVAMALATDEVSPDRVALLQVFLQHASLAIQNTEMLARVERSERMAAVGKALGFILHDLRGPIGAAQMYAKLLQSGTIPEGQMVAFVGRIHGQMERALELLSDTMGWLKGSVEIQPEIVELTMLVREAFEDFQGLATGVILENLVDERIAARIDGRRMSRVLYNLIKNGVGAVSGGEEVGVVRVEAEVTGNGVEIRVMDNGPGIPRKIRETLFDPLVSEARGGTGFGLAIVKQIVEAHDGTVVPDRVDGWTIFRIKLPEHTLV